jgi:holo-[acyl-carrier protein] synthase
MLYTGIDLIEIERIARAVDRWGDRFLDRVFTPAELAAYRARPASLAARWAAKEAVAKLLGAGLRGLGGAGLRGLGGAGQLEDALAWTEIEVLSDPEGRPALALHGRAAARAKALGLGPIALSLSHTRQHAIASALAMADQGQRTKDQDT